MLDIVQKQVDQILFIINLIITKLCTIFNNDRVLNYETTIYIKMYTHIYCTYTWIYYII